MEVPSNAGPSKDPDTPTQNTTPILTNKCTLLGNSGLVNESLEPTEHDNAVDQESMFMNESNSDIIWFSEEEDEGHGTQEDYERLTNKGVDHLCRFEENEELEDLDQAILCFREALQSCPIDHPERLNLFHNLAGSFMGRYRCMGDVQDVSRAVGFYQDILESLSTDDPDRLSTLNELANILLALFENHGDKENLMEAIQLYKELHLTLSDDDPDQFSCLNNLANSLRIRYDQFGDPGDIEEAVSYHRRAHLLMDSEEQLYSISLGNLADTLLTRYKHNGSNADLEEAIECSQKAIILRPEGHPHRGAGLNQLGRSLVMRFELQGNVEDLENAIDHYRKALLIEDTTGPNRSAALSSLASSLLTRFEVQGSSDDLESAIRYHQEALSLRKIDHPKRSSSLTSLANSLLTRFEQQGSPGDLEEAINLYQEALALRPEGHPDRPSTLNNLSTALVTRFERQGDTKHLDDAIHLCQEALRIALAENPDRASYLHDLAQAFHKRFEQRGDLGDLEQAVICHRNALLLRPPGNPRRAASLGNLATSLLTRFELQQNSTDLEEALSCCRETLNILQSGSPSYSAALNNLANTLIICFYHRGDTDNLTEAIRSYRRVLLGRPKNHPGRSTSMHDLGNALLLQFKTFAETDSINEAIVYLRDTLRLQTKGHPRRPQSLSYLGHLLESRYRHLRDMADLEEAVGLLKEALLILPPAHPQEADFKAILATIYITYSNVSGHEPLRDEALHLVSEAIDHPIASVGTKFSISLIQIAEAQARSDVDFCIHAYRTAIELADRHVLVQPLVAARHKLLAQASVPPFLASDAAAWAIVAHRVDTAVELLERGKTILWSQLGRYRAPLDALHKADGALAMEFEKVSRELENSALSTLQEDVSRYSLEDEARNYRQWSVHWDELVKRIRKIKGFEMFLATTPFSVLKQACVDGPVIVVNISHLRSDAVIILNAGDPLVVPLPEVTPDSLDKLFLDFSEAISPMMGEKTRKSKLITILRNLWYDIVEQVVNKLRSIGVAPGARIWWYPTHKLSSLPLHAAGPYRRDEPNLPEIYISSYTSTFSMLLRSQATGSSYDQTMNQTSLLVIAQPTTKGQNIIKSTQMELQVIQKIVPTIRMLLNEDGTHERTISGLKRHRWVHFACHGMQDLQNPFNSRFHLHDKPLTLLDIIQARLPSAEFAYAAACHSAAGDRNTPDETIHLAAGLQFSGFRSVIGTLYPMADIDGPLVAEEVYKHLFRPMELERSQMSPLDLKDVAKALNIATKRLKESGATLFRWINFIHIGI